ncbi:MAG: 6-phospho-3-hexuloisomerase [Flexilinea sp.]
MNLPDAKKMVINEITLALFSIDDKEGYKLIDSILEAKQVFFVGVGRVMFSLEAICKRLAHLGIDTHYVGEITEPAITKDDLLIVGSGSGESLFPVSIAKKAKSIGVKVAWIGSNPQSTLAKISDLCVRIPVQTKLNLPDELHSNQAMTSLFEQVLLLYGDIIAKMIIEKNHIDIDSLWQHHANLE